MGQKFGPQIALSSTVFEIEAFLCFAIFAKKFKMAVIWARQFFFFLKIGMTTLQRYHVDQKFHRNCSISHGFRDISIFVFSLFWTIRSD